MQKLAVLAKDRPLVTLTGAVVAGTLLGALAFPRVGRLLFVATTSLVVSELWKSQGGAGVQGLLARLTGED
jgi:hypothetical protein